jgi:large subunit ribosomal protein L4
MDIAIRSIKGEGAGEASLDDAVFGVPMNEALVHQALVAQQANHRQGTAATKSRSFVAGGGRKPRSQKHTGRSRQGSIRSPQWRGGGIVFGPQPRDYRQQLNKKMRQLAIRCLLSDKAANGRLVLVDELSLADSHTKTMLGVLEALGTHRKTLVATNGVDKAVVLASRNIPSVKTLPANLLNVQDLVTHDTLIMPLAAARLAEETFAPNRFVRRPSLRDPQGTLGSGRTVA